MTADQSAPTLSEELADFIAEQRDGYPRVADDMDSGELADAILTWLAARTADHAAELRAATSAGYIRGYGKASADAAQVARVVAAAREAGL